MLPANVQLMTPSQLNRLARDLLEGSFNLVWLEAEVSGFTRAASGHWYFTLKDSRAQIRCAMFKGANRSVASTPANGDQVQARGKISLFEARGDFQFIIDRLQPAGLGSILRAFEALKARLAAEGLFAAERKRALPRFPRRIALISSAKGAAIHDVLSILARRWPLLQVELYPTTVQGAEGAAEMLTALAAVARRGDRYDLVLLTRGGGAREDLLPFDDEGLARAIVAQPQPVVSAVGHEIDFTIADLAADVRAPTPSAAAEMIVPDAVAVSGHLQQLRQRLRRDLDNCLRQSVQEQDLAATKLRNLNPKPAIGQHRQQLRAQLQQAAQYCGRRFATEQRQLDRLHARVQAHRPANRLQLNRSRLQSLSQRWERLHGRWSRERRAAALACLARLQALPLQVRMRGMRATVSGLAQRLPSQLHRIQVQQAAQLAQLRRALEGLGPHAVLARGYALLVDPELGKPLRSISQLQPGQRVQARLVDGSASLRVESGESAD